jgi:hypothetical protein
MTSSSAIWREMPSGEIPEAQRPGALQGIVSHYKKNMMPLSDVFIEQ